MIGEDPTKPYYSTVKSSSSEGELSSDEEGKKNLLNRILPKPSEEAEEAIRKRLLEGRKHRREEDDDLLSIQPKNQERSQKPSSSKQEDRSSRHSDDNKHSTSREKERRYEPTSPPLKKRPAIKAPTPEPKEKHRRKERHHEATRSEPKHHDRSSAKRKVKSDVRRPEKETDKKLSKELTKVVVEEKVEIRRTSPTSTPTFSPMQVDDVAKSPLSLHVKSVINRERRSNTSSPLPGMQKYSRFDSPEPPESDHEMEEPVSQTEMPVSSDESDMDVGEGGEEEVIADEKLTALEAKNFELLTDEEKGLLSPTKLKEKENDYQKRLIAKLPIYYPGIYGCRSINEFKLLNRISEGTFGVVYRALEKNTDEIVALKQLKMEKETEGFPITSLREINMLMKCRRHPNVVGLREIVTDSTGEKIYMSMEFVEHDLRALMKQLEARRKKFTLAQVKSLMHQLLSGVAHMHGEWVIHRDLKTANLLLSHKNILKIGDFGLAREYGDPLKPYTSLVVTLHYRSPELLLGCKKYSTAVDVWSVGCIFGEFFKLNAIYPGQSEAEQVKLIFEGIGTPNERLWPGYGELPNVSKFDWPNSPPGQLRKRFFKDLQESEIGLDLMTKLLHPCPERRLSAEDALRHEWFTENPLPAPPESFPTWPAKSENLKAPPQRPAEPPKPKTSQPAIDPERLKLLQEFNIKPTKSVANAGFSLKLGHR